ncbi:hypothetical protein B5807_07592 [Epicoccum nigrum]|uniref:Uncharacterized protein n=1 Tax=Epicoccum nigrum TaxID=105696 RepID=A0A1Y2LWR5_EPING|nr:hypothetical protein B5807_07592 [Epicoccum nigrum]
MPWSRPCVESWWLTAGLDFQRNIPALNCLPPIAPGLHLTALPLLNTLPPPRLCLQHFSWASASLKIPLSAPPADIERKRQLRPSGLVTPHYGNPALESCLPTAEATVAPIALPQSFHHRRLPYLYSSLASNPPTRAPRHRFRRHVIAALISCDRLVVTCFLRERASSRSSLSPRTHPRNSINHLMHPQT